MQFACTHAVSTVQSQKLGKVIFVGKSAVSFRTDQNRRATSLSRRSRCSSSHGDDDDKLLYHALLCFSHSTPKTVGLSANSRFQLFAFLGYTSSDQMCSCSGRRPPRVHPMFNFRNAFLGRDCCSYHACSQYKPRPLISLLTTRNWNAI